jgi:hypothetical protein
MMNHAFCTPDLSTLPLVDVKTDGTRFTVHRIYPSETGHDPVTDAQRRLHVRVLRHLSVVSGAQTVRLPRQPEVVKIAAKCDVRLTTEWVSRSPCPHASDLRALLGSLPRAPHVPRVPSRALAPLSLLLLLRHTPGF